MTGSEKLVMDIEDATKEIEQRMADNPNLDLMSVAISLWIRASDERDRVTDLRESLKLAVEDIWEHSREYHHITKPEFFEKANAALEKSK